MELSSLNPEDPKPYRVWIEEKHVYTIDVLAVDTWQAKEYAEDHPDQWIEVDGSDETHVEQVQLHLGADFRAANGG